MSKRERDIVKGIARTVEKFGLLAAAVLAAVAGAIAAFSVQWSLGLLGFALAMSSVSILVTFRRIRQTLAVIRRGGAQGRPDPTGAVNAAEPNVAILRELHLSTLEEVRLLKAEIAHLLESSVR